MSLWTETHPDHFTADLTRLWVACDPDDVLLDEKLLTELRGRGFELMLYEDPFAFRAEYEERYRAAWDRGELGPCAIADSASSQRRRECVAVGHRASRSCGASQPCRAIPEAGLQRGTASRAGAFWRAVSCPPDRIAVSARRERVQGLHSRTRLPTDAEIHSQPRGLLARAASDALRQPLVATPVRPARGRHHSRQGAVHDHPSPHGWRPRARCCAWCRMRGIAT